MADQNGNREAWSDRVGDLADVANALTRRSSVRRLDAEAADAPSSDAATRDERVQAHSGAGMQHVDARVAAAGAVGLSNICETILNRYVDAPPLRTA